MILKMMERIAEGFFAIVEAISEIAQILVGGAVMVLFYGIVFAVLVATFPIWILPYVIWRAHKEESENE